MHILAVTTGAGADDARRRAWLLDAIRGFARESDELTELTAPADTDPGSIDRVAEAIGQAAPDVVVLLADEHGDALAPLVAGRLGWGVVTDCIRVGLDHDTVHATRTVNRGGLEVTLEPSTARSILTLKTPSTMNKALGRSGRSAAQKITVRAGDAPVAAWAGVGDSDGGPLPVAEADIVVGIGRGVTTDEQMESVRRLAGILGASIAASRQAIESGRAPAALKVGDTGLKLGAALYVAIGISGANQHVSGVESCLSLVAINKDVRAPIFGASSSGAVGDMTVLLPELCDALEARLT